MWTPGHRRLQSPVRGNSRSCVGWQCRPHLSQSDQLSLSIISLGLSHLSHTASPSSLLLVIPTPGIVTVMPNWFNVMVRKEYAQNLPALTYSSFMTLEVSDRRILKELVVHHRHASLVIIVSEVNPLLLSSAGLLVACYLHLPADHHLASCTRRDLALHVEHETLAGPRSRDVDLARLFNIRF